jgi:hypothetical protein
MSESNYHWLGKDSLNGLGAPATTCGKRRRTPKINLQAGATRLREVLG